MIKKLIVSETFHSIQGEGQTMGVPSVFLRLSGCNLLCESKEWTCDTIEVWKHGKATEFEYVFTDEQFEMLGRGDHLIITGGEPLLHQIAVKEFLTWLSKKLGKWAIVEIETNGTIIPDKDLFPMVRFWNVSPKLSNSGMPVDKRINETALHAICANVAKDRVIFKFVVNKESDFLEIIQDYNLPIKCVVLMPAGASQQELAVTRPVVADLCKKTGLRYSERLHVGIWDKATGV